jgi:hypothetical protein
MAPAAVVYGTAAVVALAIVLVTILAIISAQEDEVGVANARTGPPTAATPFAKPL